MKKQNNPALLPVAQALKEGKKFFIAGHQNPDGDSLGCTLAVASLLRRLGKQVYSYSKDLPGDDLRFLPGLKDINFNVMPTDNDFDTLVFLECSERTRGGDFEDLFKTARTTVNIDHHKTSDNYATVNYIDAQASSTAEIITSLFALMDITPTADEATCLYTGLVTDTARFLHSNTTPESMAAGATLLDAGADILTINTVLFNTKPYKELKLLGRALEKLNLLSNDKIAEITLAAKDFKALGTDPSHTQGIVSQPIMIPSVEVSVLIRQENDKVSVNLRSKGKIDVSALAKNFGGGGHARAAGFKVAKGKIAAVKKNILAAIEAEVAKLK